MLKNLPSRELRERLATFLAFLWYLCVVDVESVNIKLMDLDSDLVMQNIKLEHRLDTHHRAAVKMTL